MNNNLNGELCFHAYGNEYGVFLISEAYASGDNIFIDVFAAFPFLANIRIKDIIINKQIKLRTLGSRGSRVTPELMKNIMNTEEFTFFASEERSQRIYEKFCFEGLRDKISDLDFKIDVIYSGESIKSVLHSSNENKIEFVNPYTGAAQKIEIMEIEAVPIQNMYIMAVKHTIVSGFVPKFSYMGLLNCCNMLLPDEFENEYGTVAGVFETIPDRKLLILDKLKKGSAQFRVHIGMGK